MYKRSKQRKRDELRNNVLFAEHQSEWPTARELRVLRRRHGTSETWLRSSEAELGQCDENNLEHDKDTNGFFERIE
jgi:hypothetical protein